MSFLFGGKQEKPETPRPANIRAKDMGTNQGAQPLPVFWGRRKIGGTYITDLYKNRAKKMTETVGSGKMKQKVTTGYNYYATFAMALCAGPVTGIQKVWANDEEIWSGNISASGSDATISTTLGKLRIFWGTSGQGVPGLLAGYPAGPMPAFRHICYALAEDFFFGESVSPPNLNFLLSRVVAPLSVSNHAPGGDALIPEVIYELLTNPIYGAAVPVGRIDKASFDTAAQTTLGEGLQASPLLESTADLKSTLADLLGYINGAVVSENGKIRLLLQRNTGGTLPAIGIDQLLEEPQILRPSWSETWSDTRVTYTDREREYDSNVAVYSDPANAAIAGVSQKEFQRPHITDGAVAMKIAAAIGSQAGVPAATAKLILQPSADVRPGDHFSLNYPPLGILSLPMVCKSSTIGGPENPRLEVEAIEDLSRVSEAAFVADPPEIPVIPIQGPADAFFRIAALPEGLKEGLPDGMLVCAARPNQAIIGATLYTNWSLQETWRPEAEISAFAIPATVNRWRAQGAFWILDVTLDNPEDQDDLTLLRDQLATLYAATCVRNVDADTGLDQHSVAASFFLFRPGGRFEPVDVNRWEIEVQGGQFESQDLLPATPGIPAVDDPEDPENSIPAVPSTPGWNPCRKIFIGSLSSFAAFPSDVYFFQRAGGNAPQDTAQTRFTRLPTHTGVQAQEIGNVPTQRFERLNTSMNPAGTLVENWGPAVAPAEWTA